MAFIAAAVCCYSIPVLIDDIKNGTRTGNKTYKRFYYVHRPDDPRISKENNQWLFKGKQATLTTRDFTMFTDRMTQELARRIISGSLKESRRHLLLATQFCKSANIICNITYNNFVKIFKRRKLFEFIIEK